MEWYVPLTILPAIGLIITSTSSFIIALNAEIIQLEIDEVKNKKVIPLKLGQLKKLGIANAFLYGSALVFLIAGLSKAVNSKEEVFSVLMISATIFTTIALVFLFIHSIKSVQIRQNHLKL